MLSSKQIVLSCDISYNGCFVRYVPYGALKDVSSLSFFLLKNPYINYIVRSSHTLADEPSRTNLFWEMEGLLGKGEGQGGRSGNGLLDERALLSYHYLECGCYLDFS